MPYGAMQQNWGRVRETEQYEVEKNNAMKITQLKIIYTALGIGIVYSHSILEYENNFFSILTTASDIYEYIKLWFSMVK